MAEEDPARSGPEGEGPSSAEEDGRLSAVWRQWLASMASDAEAALAAAIAYRDMDSDSRERWLGMLESDSRNVDVPKIALYAPLLSVERDPDRRGRLLLALGRDAEQTPPTSRAEALRGRQEQNVYVLVVPLYLDFVQVLACAISDRGFTWVRHDPIVRRDSAPRAGERVLGTLVERTPMKSALDQLASAVLAHRRSGRPLPEALEVLSNLLAPDGD